MSATMPAQPPAPEKPAARTTRTAGAASPGGFSPDVVHRAVSYWVAQLPRGHDTSRNATRDHRDHDGERQGDDGVALAAWRAAHPEHERAWQHLQSVSRRLQSIDGVADTQPDGASPSEAATIRAARRHAALSALPGGTTERRKAPNTRRRTILKTTLMLVGFGSAGALLTEAIRDRIDFGTGVGETRVAILDDGTRITLDTRSAIQVRFTQTERRVMLVRGAIMIQTGHAAVYADRPFVLQTAQGTLTPLGTRFSALQTDGRTRLDVFEGAVRIQPTRAPATGVVIHPGERVTFDARTVSPITTTPIGADAWVDGMLVANGMSLADFCAALSRYRPGILRCADDIGQLRLSGTYPIHDTDRVLDALPHTLPVRIDRRTRYWTRVESART